MAPSQVTKMSYRHQTPLYTYIGLSMRLLFLVHPNSVLWGTLADVLTAKLEEYLASLSYSSPSQKPLCPQFSWHVFIWGIVCQISSLICGFCSGNSKQPTMHTLLHAPSYAWCLTHFQAPLTGLQQNQVRIHWESGKEATLCHWKRQKHEKSCLTGTLVLQGLVTRRTVCDRVSSNQSPLWWPIKGSKTAKINGSRTWSRMLE